MMPSVRIFAVSLIMVVSMSACRSNYVPPVPEQVALDLERAKGLAENLSERIEPDGPWRGGARPELACFGPNGLIRGYQASYSKQIKADAVGHDLDVAKFFETGRDWLTRGGFELIVDRVNESGSWEIRAVHEAEEIGISIFGYEKIVGVTATTKCRSV